MFSMRKVGGLYHWRIGRLGGSFYWARAKKVTVMVSDRCGLDRVEQMVMDLERVG